MQYTVVILYTQQCTNRRFCWWVGGGGGGEGGGRVHGSNGMSQGNLSAKTGNVT